jgi:hypothetical protein
VSDMIRAKGALSKKTSDLLSKYKIRTFKC